ncbi:hypothetical protein PAXINDRAFT_157355 [Paxillus involutus ATCC 200175]|uniref:Uncharacterized protein n=1 Tax=Paxillus involutus ATCC 200175 TaxID=664439 RepID=A0A0C9SSI6_PAXIN|nr:hypothetical protein PAXINDRAFT_157355 [Paxillus involutus ATCC 200175]
MYYFKVSRTNTNAKLGSRGDALDRVEVVPHHNPARNDRLLNELSWSMKAAPRLYDVSRIFVYIRDIHPAYQLFTKQCYFFACTAYEAMKILYAPVTEAYGDNHKTRTRFPFVFGAGKSAAEKATDSIVRVERTLAPLFQDGQGPDPADVEGGVPVTAPSQSESEGAGPSRAQSDDVRINVVGRLKGIDVRVSMRGRGSRFADIVGQVNSGRETGPGDVLAVGVQTRGLSFEGAAAEGRGPLRMHTT